MHIQEGLVNSRLSRRLSKLEIEMVPPEPLEEFTVSHTASWGLSAGDFGSYLETNKTKSPAWLAKPLTVLMGLTYLSE